MLVKLSIKELEAMKNVVVKMGKVMDEETSISLTELQEMMKFINNTNLMKIKFDIAKGLSIKINPDYVCDIYELYGDLITGTFLIMKNPIKRLMEFYEDFGYRFEDIVAKYEEKEDKKSKGKKCKCSCDHKQEKSNKEPFNIDTPIYDTFSDVFPELKDLDKKKAEKECDDKDLVKPLHYEDDEEE